MSKPPQTIALMCAHSLSLQQDGSAPYWVHLLPTASGEVETGDDRGPYHVTDAAKIVSDSLPMGERIPLDENHSTDLAAPKGLPSPAVGWIVEMEVRKDGIWGRVEWNSAGKSLLVERAYRAISPVILCDKSNHIVRILRASLVNRPNLRGLATLNQESDMTLLERLAELLGLDAASSETEIFDAVNAMKENTGGDGAALQSQMSEIGVALGLGEGGDAQSILAAATKAKSETGSDDEAIVALQAENADLATKLNAIVETTTKDKATTFIDGEIKRGRAGLKPLREHYIAMHMKDAERVEKEIGAMPVLTGSGTSILPPAAKDGEVALNAEQLQAAKLIGVSAENYAKTLTEEAH